MPITGTFSGAGVVPHVSTRTLALGELTPNTTYTAHVTNPQGAVRIVTFASDAEGGANVSVVIHDQGQYHVEVFTAPASVFYVSFETKDVTALAYDRDDT